MAALASAKYPGSGQLRAAPAPKPWLQVILDNWLTVKKKKLILTSQVPEQAPGKKIPGTSPKQAGSETLEKKLALII